jgi:hypothetical protein
MPESLVGALEGLGHEVDSVNHLKLKGLDNGTLYRQVAKVLRVIVPQQKVESFVPAFVDALQKSDWSHYSNGDDWP